MMAKTKFSEGTKDEERYKRGVKKYLGRGSVGVERTNGYIERKYAPGIHKQAKEDVLDLILKGYAVRIYDHSGWTVTFVPPDAERHATPSGASRTGGRRYLETQDAGLIPSFEWGIYAIPYEPDQYFEPLGTLKRD